MPGAARVIVRVTCKSRVTMSVVRRLHPGYMVLLFPDHCRFSITLTSVPQAIPTLRFRITSVITCSHLSELACSRSSWSCMNGATMRCGRRISCIALVIRGRCAFSVSWRSTMFGRSGCSLLHVCQSRDRCHVGRTWYTVNITSKQNNSLQHRCYRALKLYGHTRCLPCIFWSANVVHSLAMTDVTTVLAVVDRRLQYKTPAGYTLLAWKASR